jgi:hypothetical protein
VAALNSASPVAHAGVLRVDAHTAQPPNRYVGCVPVSCILPYQELQTRRATDDSMAEKLLFVGIRAKL